MLNTMRKMIPAILSAFAVLLASSDALHLSAGDLVGDVVLSKARGANPQISSAGTAACTNTTGGLMPVDGCLEAYVQCARCDFLWIYDISRQGYTGNQLKNPVAHTCQGQRMIGDCTATKDGTGYYCDLSNPYFDGTPCTDVVYNYQSQ